LAFCDLSSLRTHFWPLPFPSEKFGGRGKKKFTGDRGPPEPNAIGYAKHRSRSHPAVIRVHDEADNVIETHEHTGEFKEW
jgi:hypothetical protein